MPASRQRYWAIPASSGGYPPRAPSPGGRERPRQDGGPCPAWGAPPSSASMQNNFSTPGTTRSAGTAPPSCASGAAGRSPWPATARSRWARPSSRATPARCAASAPAARARRLRGRHRRRLHPAGAAGGQARALPGQLERACVELAKDWRTDRYLRRLEAMMAVADADALLTLTGNGDVLEPEDGVIAIGSGGNYALAAARALMEVDGLSPRRWRAGPCASPATSASTPTTNVDRRDACRHGRPHLLAARDRLRARPLHRRPERRQARRRHRPAQPLAPRSSCPRRCARRSCPRTS